MRKPTWPEPSPPLTIEFDMRSEGPSEVWRTITNSMAGLIVQVLPLDHTEPFLATMMHGTDFSESDDGDDPYLLYVQRIDDDDWEPLGDPEWVRVSGLRLNT